MTNTSLADPNGTAAASSTFLAGAVADILSPTQIAINIGRDQGVQTGDVFSVKQKTPREIRDPNSGELLGVIDREKVAVKVIEVDNRFSICETFEIVGRREPSAFFEGLGGPNYSHITRSFSAMSLLGDPGSPGRQRTLQNRDAASDNVEPLDESSSYVKVGDRVEQVITPAERSEQRPH